MNAKTKLMPTGHGITCEVTTISPEVAAAMLDQSPGNRKIAPGTVSAYARDMKAKRWALTTEPICFDKKGALLNGHHRLKACIEADTPFQTLVSYGLEPSARDFMDQGRPRKAADVLTFAGYHNTLKLAALANMLMVIKSGSYDGGSRLAPYGLTRHCVANAGRNLPVRVLNQGHERQRQPICTVRFEREAGHTSG